MAATKTFLEWWQEGKKNYGEVGGNFIAISPNVKRERESERQGVRERESTSRAHFMCGYFSKTSAFDSWWYEQWTMVSYTKHNCLVHSNVIWFGDIARNVGLENFCKTLCGLSVELLLYGSHLSLFSSCWFFFFFAFSLFNSGCVRLVVLLVYNFGPLFAYIHIYIYTAFEHLHKV